MKLKSESQIMEDVEMVKQLHKDGNIKISSKLFNILSKDDINIKEINNKEEYNEYVNALMQSKKINKNIEKRKYGAEKFGDFCINFEKILLGDYYDKNDEEQNKKLIIESILPIQQIAGIQLIFLGLKPLMSLDFSIIKQEQINDVCLLFEKYGLKTKNNNDGVSIIIYNKDLVNNTVKKYKEYFGGDDIIEKINLNIWELSDMELGLLFGYPTEACLGYIENKKKSDKEKKILNQKAWDYLKEHENNNEYGFTFLRYNAGNETKKLMEKTKLAFKKSGILKKRDTLKNK